MGLGEDAVHEVQRGHERRGGNRRGVSLSSVGCGCRRATGYGTICATACIGTARRTAARCCTARCGSTREGCNVSVDGRCRTG